MDATVLVSIVIDNYNYARFLRAAIDSALGQTYPHTEVIVVDDGSTDDSKTIIQGYGERVTAVFKANAGQASALNAGFCASQGGIVIFLDADDTLLPDTVARVVECFQQQPAAAKAVYRLAIMDQYGELTGEMTPSTNKLLPQGEIRAQLLRNPDDLPWPPTSGNAFRHKVLAKIFPIPEADYPICADYYLSNLTPLFGDVTALAGVGGHYRVHGTNYHHSAHISLERRRTIIQLTLHTHEHLRRTAQTQGVTTPLAFHSLSFLAHRLLSLKMNRGLHPVSQDSIKNILGDAMTTLLNRIDIPLSKKVVMAGWFWVTAFVPRRVIPALDSLYFKSGT